jgi:hypothetical protein
MAAHGQPMVVFGLCWESQGLDHSSVDVDGTTPAQEGLDC